VNQHSISSRPLTQPRGLGALPAALLLSALALLAAIYAQLWIGLLSLPALDGVDFISFYTAGRIVRAGTYGLLYDLDVQHAIQVPIIGPNFVPGGTLPYNHPPLFAPLLGLIAFDDYRSAYIAYSAILLGLLLLCAVVAARFLAEHGFDRRARMVAASSVVLFYPAFISLLKGQDTAFVLLGALIWMWALLARRERLAGVALALALLKPQIALALALPLLASRNRAAWWFCGTSALVGLYSWLLVGTGGLLGLLGLLRLSSDGQGYGMNQPAMYNFLGLLIRGAPTLDAGTLSLLKWAVYVLAIGCMCWLWWGKRDALTIPQIGVAVALSLFASPHLHLHDLSLLLLPALGAMALLWRAGRLGRLAALALLPASSLLLFASDLVGAPLHFVAGYALMFALLIGLGSRLRAARVAPSQPAQEV
jgi:hypothetical protein